MTEGFLYPRLPPAVARRRFEELQLLPLSLLPSEARSYDSDAVFAALGGAEVDEPHLQSLRAALIEVGTRAGYPVARGTRATRERFDIECAAVLSEQMRIVAAEAAAIDVWAFIGVMLVPDLCFWRFPNPPEDRVIGPDLTRHTLARLWWRAHQLADLEPTTHLGALEVIPENVMNQIFERRAIGGNRELVRGVARVLIATQDRWPSLPRRRLVRDGVRRLRRLLAFTSPESLDEALLAQLIEGVFEDTASALLSEPADAVDANPQDDGHEDDDSPISTTAPSANESHEGVPNSPLLDFDDVPLAGIPAQIAELVNELGGVRDADLAAAFERSYGIQVPAAEHQLLHRFAWSAKGRRFIDLDQDNDLWLPGSTSPTPIEQLEDWTISRIGDRAAALLRAQPETDPFEQLVGEVYKSNGGRVPRLIMSLVGKILNKAKRDLNGGIEGGSRRGR